MTPDEARHLKEEHQYKAEKDLFEGGNALGIPRVSLMSAQVHATLALYYQREHELLLQKEVFESPEPLR